MYPSPEAREITTLLRISREVDICGDLTATVDNPSELIAWATVLTEPEIVAWQATDSGSRFVQVSADHRRAPVRGRVAAVLTCEQHPAFWDALGLTGLPPGRPRTLRLKDLSAAWAVMPINPPDSQGPPEPPASGHAA
jgi:hypothetical protein